MSAPESLTDFGFLSVLLLGLSVGLTTCTAVCLPYLGTWAFGQAQGGKQATLDTLWFALGKITAYAFLGALAGLIGETLIVFLKGNIGHHLIGVFAIISGLLLIFPYKRKQGCNRSGLHNASPFSMGFALSFSPCAPMAALLAASATTASFFTGGIYGALFGVGAALTPLFIIIPLLGKFGQKIKQSNPWLGRWLLYFAGLVLVIIGLRRIWLGL